MHELIEGLQGVEVIADDFLVYGKNEKAHDMHLHAFLRRCEERNVVLSDEKLKLKSSEVPFIGHMATPEGLMAAPEKISAVMNMPQPTDVASVRRFLGMVQYLAKFLPQLSDMTQPLRVLTQKDIDFSWGTAQERAFKAVKLAVTKTPVLRYYSLDEEVTVQCDASKDGLGAALLQNGQPVAYASRSLTDCESRYAQIEKECLAIVFACERFDFYLFGRDKVTVDTDHMPLESIFKKSLDAAPARLQKMRLRLQRYSLKVIYKKGTQMYLADTLSRAVACGDSVKQFEVNNVQAMSQENDTLAVDPRVTLMVREDNIKKIQSKTADDLRLVALAAVIKDICPTHKNSADVVVWPYFSFRDELTTHDGLIFKGQRLVVP